MSMIWIKKILLLWMILWLPISGAMAAIMPFAGSPTQVKVHASADDEEFVASMPCHESSHDRIVLGEGCNHCVLCHLAGALTLSTLPVVPTMPPAHVFSATPIATHPSFVPELLIPPPRFALA